MENGEGKRVAGAAMSLCFLLYDIVRRAADSGANLTFKLIISIMLFRRRENARCALTGSFLSSRRKVPCWRNRIARKTSNLG